MRTQLGPEAAYQKSGCEKAKEAFEGTGQEQRLIPQERALPEIGQISAIGLTRLYRPNGAATAPSQPSDIYLLCDHKRVVDLDAKVPHGAFNLGMSERTRVIMHILLSH